MNWAYIAGFFDGEGSVHVPMGNRCMGSEVAIHQGWLRGKFTLEEIAQFLASNDIRCRVKLRDSPSVLARRHAPMFILRITGGENVRRFYLGVAPYLRIKRTEFQDAMRFRKMFPPYKTRTLLGWEKRKSGGNLCVLDG
jgi:hypothetical protein